MEKKKSYLIGIIYIFSYVIFLITGFEYEIYTFYRLSQNIFGYAPQSSWDIFNFVGNLFIIFSIISVFFFNIKKAIITGLIGSVIILFGLIFLLISNLIGNIYPIPYELYSSYGDHYILPIVNYVSFFLVLIFFIINFYSHHLLKKRNVEEEALIKRKVLDYGTKATRLKIRDISDRTNVDKDTTIKVLRAMIKNKEIFAEYFSSSKTVAFNQLANVDQINDLMEIYREWEQEKIEKV